MIRSGMFVLLICLSGAALAQKSAVSMPVDFPDSLRIVLEKTRNMDATVAGASLVAVWPSLAPDQQLKVRRHVAAMKRLKLPLRPTITNYIAAIGNAIQVEKVDLATLSTFLKVCDQAIAQEKTASLGSFFKLANVFFQRHAIHYEKPFRLYVAGGTYAFDYIAPAPAYDPYDTTTMTSGEESAPSLDESSPDTTIIDPLLMNLPPPPVQEGPIIRFTGVNLGWVTAYDSVWLSNTRGTFSLRDGIWAGEGGSFDWSPAGLGPDSVICNLTTYSFATAKPEWSAPLVKLNYIGHTPGFIPGTFEFKSQARPDSVLSTYPRFKSYGADLQLQGVGDESVTFKGGFSLTGNRISSANVNGDYSVLEVSHNGARRMISRSVDFTFNDGLIIGTRSMTTLYQGNDSLAHPSIGMKYRYGEDSLRMISLRTERGPMKHTPFTSSFFGVDFATDVVEWNLYADSLNLRVEGGRDDVPMIIESNDYYDIEDYRILSGTDFRFNPVGVVATYCIKNKTREFYSGDLISSMSKIPAGEIKRALEMLHTKGYLVYNPRTDVVQVKEKLVAVFKAFKGERDYDNMKIHSVIDSFPNATLNMEEGYMTVRGVEEFNISDSLNVKIIPDSSVITLLRNRDIKFDGTVTAGNFEISGKGFALRYDSFFIHLDKIDSINFFTIEKTATGQTQRKKIPNSMVGADSTAASAGGLGNIRNSSGTLFISKSNNKSGRKKIPNYPRLDATTGGAIYFDREEVLGGVYDRSMFFVVPPFKLDSLNDADPTSINFDGTFVSSGMFPSFKEKLHTMPDKSLGFEHTTPKDGLKLYNGDGKYTGVLRLDHQGLRGKGTIDYLAASLRSDDFLYYPDSVVGKGSGLLNGKQYGNVNFPQASLENFDMKWFPKEDKMRLKNTREPFQFYNNTAQMQGTLGISKSGVTGMGKLETRGTELISRTMNFNTNDFSARHGRFKVKSDDPAKPLLTGTDVRMKFNLQQNYADISPEIEGDAAIDFPFAQIRTSIPNMRWDLNTQKITMTKAKDVPIENSYFYSTRPELDSLVFNADRAEYDIRKQELKVSGIPYIVVADARITPENNEVMILENSRIGTLKNTVIILDTLNAYHRLTNGVVDIKSRKEFSGYATYQYVNFLNDTFAIKMTDFHLDEITGEEISRRSSRRKTSSAKLQTVGVGKVAEGDKMVLGAGMFYKGDITMYATRPALQLSGYVKLDIKRIKNYKTWIRYEQTGEEQEVLIDFANALNEEGRKVDAGLHLESMKNNLYISFLSDKINEDDDDIFTPEGMLYYDTASNEFKIEDLAKARGEKLSGKVFAFRDKDLKVRFEGPVSLFRGGTKDFNVSATALGDGSLETNEISMNTFMMLESNVPAAAFELMARQLMDVIKNEGADEGLGDQTELLYKIADIVGEKVVRDYEKKSLQGYVSLGTLPEFFKPLVISNVNMKWSQKAHAFYNEGKIGISNIFKNDINGAFEGFLEIGKAEDGTSIFRLFLKASPEAWYYIDYENSKVMVHSSNEAFNSIITKKTNAGKVKLGEVAFIPGSDDETLQFINRFRKTYYGIDVPYSLSDGVAGAQKKKEEKTESADGF